MAFECGICALVFNNSSRVPIILECGHSFCKDCLRRKLGPHKHCPYCRNPIRKDLEHLPRCVMHFSSGTAGQRTLAATPRGLGSMHLLHTILELRAAV